MLEIIDYTAEYQPVFRQLNEEWITANFKMEESDNRTLDHPDEYILEKGGFIFIALFDHEPAGACALIKINNDVFELAKMAVSPYAKGNGIGYLLGQTCINRAKETGAKKLQLQSNTVLVPAINLYHKLGFKEVDGEPSPYKRCNIQMELYL